MTKKKQPDEKRPEPEMVEAKKEKEVKKFPYSIAPGKSITSKKGILGPGDEAKVAYFAGGAVQAKKTLDKLVKSGHIIKA